LVGVALVVFGPGVMWPANVTADGSAGAGNTNDSASPTSATPSQAPGASAAPSASSSAKAPSNSHTPWGKPPSASGFPDATNTGVPRGTTLTPYTGPCTITTSNLVIDAKLIKCSVLVRAKGVVIKRSKIIGQLGTWEDTPFSYTLEDSEVDAGIVQGAVVGSTNITVIRANIHGGATSVYCYSSCTIRDSYLHGQRLPDTADWHLGAFLANDNGHDPGGRTNAVLIHNTIHCDAQPNAGERGGCSGDVNLYGDFGPITYVTIDNNLIAANPTGVSFCLYGGESKSKPYPHADHVVVVNNVFQRGSNRKCGAYGGVGSFDITRPGNVWANNVWDDGATVKPEN